MLNKLCHENPDQFEFTASVIEVVKEDKLFKAVLDHTYFFPEGGGQPSDKGYLNQHPVIDVQEEGGKIYHYVNRKIEKGPVTAKIDRQHRVDFQQQHTGQHIISAALWKIGGYKTLSVHFGRDYTTIELETPDITEQEIQSAEALANQIILQNKDVTIINTHGSLAENYPLRKPCSIKGDIRLVQIEGTDVVACCGLHVKNTRDIGLVKAVGRENIRGNTRISWKIGRRAYQDYQEKTRIFEDLRLILETDEARFFEKIEKLKDHLAESGKKCSLLENRLARRLADDLIKKGIKHPAHTIITDSLSNEDESLLKKVLKALIENESTVFCITNRLKNSLTWHIGCSEGLNLPFSAIRNEVLPLIDGKGGGRPPLWQGIGRKVDAVPDFFKAFLSLFNGPIRDRLR